MILAVDIGNTNIEIGVLPFKKDDFIFAHNGTIFDDLKVYKKYIKGNSDSVNMFNIILHGYNNNVTNFTVKDYTAVNFILISSKHIQVAQKYKMNPKYSTMKMMQDNDLLMVSSEILPSYKNKKC